MGATFEQGGTGVEFERLDAGMYPATCIHVVELGTHDNTHPQAKPGTKKKDLLLVFETEELMPENDEGKQLPYVLSLRCTNSLGERATLRKHLESWRGKAFTDDELINFSVDKVLGKPCILNVTKEEKKGKTYNNIKGVNPLMKGMTVTDPVNEMIDFGIHDIETETFKKLWPWVQKIITASYEAKELGLTLEPKEEEDDVPF